MRLAYSIAHYQYVFTYLRSFNCDHRVYFNHVQCFKQSCKSWMCTIWIKYNNIIIVERLSAKLLIVQRSQFAFVCVYVCMYIRHTLIAWAQFLWSRPQTTSHVVLVRPGGDRRSCACESGKEQGLYYWYWSDQEAIDV